MGKIEAIPGLFVCPEKFSQFVNWLFASATEYQVTPPGKTWHNPDKSLFDQRHLLDNGLIGGGQANEIDAGRYRLAAVIAAVPDNRIVTGRLIARKQ